MTIVGAVELFTDVLTRLGLPGTPTPLPRSGSHSPISLLPARPSACGWRRLRCSWRGKYHSSIGCSLWCLYIISPGARAVPRGPARSCCVRWGSKCYGQGAEGGF
ncbi:hypothetical protein C8J57DRAFT_1527676 [Mycena rebaudengoi]|nr:hypothetical protein C8J57DRAFT_1527676 [Mycena rebaudengoi]